MIQRSLIVLGAGLMALTLCVAGPARAEPQRQPAATADKADKADKSSAAQTGKKPTDMAPAQAPAPAPGALAVQPGVPMPDDYKINLLIRTTILAVNQANRTGNYTVLRDLGAPGFQKANTAAQLGELFANQRKANFDLSPVLFFDPKLVAKPAIDATGRLRVTGFFETAPQQVNFDLVFENVEGEWRHFALGIGTQLAGKRE